MAFSTQVGQQNLKKDIKSYIVFQKQECALKDFIWKLKQDKIQFNINWSIMRQSKSYAAGDKACLLCLDEKLAIMENSKNPKIINKDICIGGKCLHKFKFLINNWKKLPVPKNNSQQ